MLDFRLFPLICLGFLWAGTAQAALKVCNETAFEQSVSVGYQGDDGWTSEGWWNVGVGDCVTTLSGDLKQRYFYYRAEVDGGDFEGQNYFFCTSPKVYTIVGDSDCESRGYEREDFREIDAGEGVRDYTLTLITTPDDTAQNPPASSSNPGLRICNETGHTQGVSIGYQADAGWTSEGWWNISPKDCATVVTGPLRTRYYYYRAEIDGGPFDHGNFYFCTTPKEYTIIGETECEARGYDRENFAEIDTGVAAEGFTLTLVSDDESAVDGTSVDGVEQGLRVCNETASVQAVSVGYEGEGGWTSEGWWNISPQDCSKVLGGPLSKQYYYYRAEVDGGDFPGGGYFFCTSPQEYTIVGDTECESRGHDREDFAEINVGSGVTGFTLTLVDDPADGGAETSGETRDDAADVAGGLRICNETAHTQSVSIGYQGPDDAWISEGWWNLDPQQCATVVGGALQKRYYYYRAEIDGGPFDGGGYSFCTSPQEYTIVGDTECEARGYEPEDFAEIDTGPTSKSFVFTLVDAERLEGEPQPSEEPAPEVAGDAQPPADLAEEDEPEAEVAGDPEAGGETGNALEDVPEIGPMGAPERTEAPSQRRGGSRGN